jgi:hypothetical protein
MSELNKVTLSLFAFVVYLNVQNGNTPFAACRLLLSVCKQCNFTVTKICVRTVYLGLSQVLHLLACSAHVFFASEELTVRCTVSGCVQLRVL